MNDSLAVSLGLAYGATFLLNAMLCAKADAWVLCQRPESRCGRLVAMWWLQVVVVLAAVGLFWKPMRSCAPNKGLLRRRNSRAAKANR